MPPSERLTLDQALSKAKKAVKSGNHTVAAELFSAVLRQQPNHPVAKKGLRKLQRQMKQGPLAKARSAEPAQEQVNGLLTLIQSGHMEEAEAKSRTLLADLPKSLVVMNILGISLQRQGKLRKAIDIFDGALKIKPDLPETWVNRGSALRELGRTDEALVSYDRAIELKPDFAEPHFNRANVLKGIGRENDAAASFSAAISIWPSFTEAHRGLSTCKRYRAGDPQIEAMERLFLAENASETDRMELGFALAKVYEDLGDVDKSFDYLAEGNRLRKQLMHYDIDDDRHLFAQIKGLFPQQNIVASEARDVDRSIQPLFIVGMMRSGTSLVEQILASHSEVHGAGELETMNRLITPMLFDLYERGSGDTPLAVSTKQISTLRSVYLDELANLGVPERIITDKMPLNFRWIGFILSAFPDAKIVHLRRDPIATCWSIYKHYFPDAFLYAYDLDDLAQYYLLYSDLMSFWRSRYPNSIYDLDYERLTENQEDETRKLLAFCSLDWEDQCLEFHKTDRQVKTLSASQVRKEIYQGSSDAWKKYASHLQILIDQLGRLN